jgi:hypothetical protein
MGRWPDIGDLTETVNFRLISLRPVAISDIDITESAVAFFAVSAVEERVPCISRSPNLLGSSALRCKPATAGAEVEAVLARPTSRGWCRVK